MSDVRLTPAQERVLRAADAGRLRRWAFENFWWIAGVGRKIGPDASTLSANGLIESDCDRPERWTPTATGRQWLADHPDNREGDAMSAQRLVWAKDITCPTCRAAPGERCHSVGGEADTFSMNPDRCHWSRTRPVRDDDPPTHNLNNGHLIEFHQGTRGDCVHFLCRQWLADHPEES